MNLKAAIDTLRTELRKFTTQKQSFADYKLVDGTVVRVDGDLVAGTAVYVITENETLPAPDGEHQVEGVGTIKTEGGKITEVVVAEAPAPAAEVAAQEVEIEVSPEGEAPEAPAAPGVGLTPEAVQEIVAKHLAAIMDELKAAMEVEMGKMKDKMAAFASQMETMTDIVEKVAELPSEAPKPTASAIVEQRRASATQNFNALAEAIQNLKKSKQP
jgi:Asp-tRNA(Asn)/Glu-tRNA(Gln) amidotransferase C subunit